MKKNYKNKSTYLVASLLVLLAGCAAIIPTWIIDTTDASGTRTVLFGSQSTNTIFYKFTYPSVRSDTIKEATLTTINIEGETQNSITIPFLTTSYSAAYKALQLSNSSSFLVDDDLRELIYVDPEEGTSWNGTNIEFPVAAERLTTYSPMITAQDELMLRGIVERSSEEGLIRTPYIGLISSEGEFLYFEEFSEAKHVSILPLLDSKNYLLVVNYKDEIADELGHKSYMEKRSEELATIAEFQFDQSSRVYRASETKLLADIRNERGSSSYGVFDYNGNKLSDWSRLDFEGYPYESPLIGDGFYYDVRVVEDEVGAVLFDLPTYLDVEVVKVCQYDFDFNENWCQQSERAGYADIENAQILEDGVVAFTYSTEGIHLSNVNVGIIPDELTFLADLSIDGTVKHQLQHMIYASDGRLSKEAKEDAYSYSGELGFGLFTFFTVEQERFNPGVIQGLDSHFFSNQAIVSSSIFSDGDDRTPRLTFWKN